MSANRLGRYFSGLQGVRGKAGATPLRRTLNGLVNKTAGSAYDDIAADLFRPEDFVPVDTRVYVQTELDATISNSGQIVIDVTAPKAFVQTNNFFVKITEAIPVSVRAFTQVLNGEGDSTGDTGVLSATSGSSGVNWRSLGSTAWTSPNNITSSDNSRATINANASPLRANFDYSSVPIGATITGMIITVESSNTFGAEPSVYLAWNATDTATNAGYAYPTSDGNLGYTYSLTGGTGDTTSSGGSSSTQYEWSIGSPVTGSHLRQADTAWMISMQALGTHNIDYVSSRVYWSKKGLKVFNPITIDAPLEITFGRGTRSNTGWTNGGTAAIMNWGADTSTNASNALTQSDTQASLIFTGTNISDDLYITNFGFAIPSSAAIDGVELEADTWSNLSSITRGLKVNFANVDNGTTFNGTFSHSKDLNQLPSSDTDTYLRFTSSLRRVGYNGWGGMDVSGVGTGTTYRPLTPTIINDTNFGPVFYVDYYGGSSSGTVFVDHVRVNVYYTDGGIYVGPPIGSDIVSVDLKTFTQTLQSVNVNEKQLVSTKAFTQTTLDVKVTERITVATKAFTQTLQPVNVNEKQLVNLKTFTQTLQPTNVNEKQLVDLKVFTQTFNAVTIIESSAIQVSTKAFTQTLQPVNVNEKQLVNLKTFTQTLLPVNVNEKQFVSTRAFTQTLQPANINAKEVVPFTTKAFTQTFYDLDVEADYIAFVDTHPFTQTLFDVDVFEREVEGQVKTGGGGKLRKRWIEDLPVEEVEVEVVDDEEEIVEPIAKPTDADIQAFAESLTPEEQALDLSALADAKALFESEAQRRAEEALALRQMQEEEEMAVVMTLAAYSRRKGFLRR